MGIDFYACDRCHETFPDCGNYSSCDDCGHMICEGCMEELAIVGRMTSEDCPFCRLDHITDSMLVDYLINKLDSTREELEAEFRAKYQADEPPEDEEPWAVG